MTIIALLIGGILKGQQLVHNAKIKRTISDLNSFRAATFAFRDKYAQLPGDMVTATQRIPGCDNANWCSDGDGNGFIGWFTWWNADQTGGPGGPVTHGASSSGQGDADDPIETSMFWKHLVLADLISGVNPGAPPGAPAWGETHPSAPFDGGYHTQHTADDGTGGSPNGQWIRLQGPVTGKPHDGTSGNEPLKPLWAADIDRKMDDGKPGTGFVMAVSNAQHDGVRGCARGGKVYTEGYNETLNARDCILFFKLHGK